MNSSGIEESFFKAILYPERVNDPVLRKIAHAFKHVWHQTSPAAVYMGVLHIFNQAWIECNPDMQEKWEL